MNSVQKSAAIPTVDRSTTQAEEMRQQRNQEARQLIGGSVNKAKAIFIQNTSSAANAATKPTKTAPAKPIRNSITRSSSTQNQQSPDRKSLSTEHLPEQPPIPMVETIHVTLSEPITPTPHHNNNGNGQHVDPTNDDTNEQLSPHHGLDVAIDDDTDAYSTIKRSPYSKSQNANNNQESTPATESKEVKSANVIQPAEQQYANTYGK